MTTIAARREKYNWRVFSAWLVSSFVGMALSMLAALTLMWSVAGAIGPAAGETTALLAGGAIFGLGLGLGSGLLPGLALRQRLGGLGRWLAASLVAGAAGGAAVFPLAISQGTSEPGWAVLVALGAVLGLRQWLALRGRVARAGWWVLASALAVGTGLAVGFQLGGAGREAIAIGGMALVYALISAATIGWILAEGD